MIRSFKDRRAQAIFEGRHPGKGFPADVIGRARRKLIMLDEAETLGDLGKLPGNHLSQWRVCFAWNGSDALDVEIADYH